MTQATNIDTLKGKITLGIAALVCTLVVFLFAPHDQARADTLLSYSGYAGPSQLIEPSARCTYNQTYNTITVTAYGVKAWARAGYNNGQWIAYRYRVFESNANNGWYQIGASNYKYAVAYPNSIAPLQNFATTFKRGYTSGYSYQHHKVLVDIYWYNASGTAVAGSVTRQVDWYDQYGNLRYGSCMV